MRYIVKDPAGVFIGGDRIPKGEPVPDGISSSQLAVWKRFGQIIEVKEKPEPVKQPPVASKPPEQKPPEKPPEVGDNAGGNKPPNSKSPG